MLGAKLFLSVEEEEAVHLSPCLLGDGMRGTLRILPDELNGAYPGLEIPNDDIRILFCRDEGGIGETNGYTQAGEHIGKTGREGHMENNLPSRGAEGIRALDALRADRPRV